MEIIIALIIAVYFPLILVAVLKVISNANITINVEHKNSFAEAPFNDIYDEDGDAKKEQDISDAFNEVFKEFNELMLGEESTVKSDG